MKTNATKQGYCNLSSFFSSVLFHFLDSELRCRNRFPKSSPFLSPFFFVRHRFSIFEEKNQRERSGGPFRSRFDHSVFMLVPWHAQNQSYPIMISVHMNWKTYENFKFLHFSHEYKAFKVTAQPFEFPFSKIHQVIQFHSMSTRHFYVTSKWRPIQTLNVGI